MSSTSASAGKLKGRGWKHVVKATLQRFSINKSTDLAASLTYYAVLALFPGLLAVVSVLKLSGIGETLVPELTALIKEAVPDQGTVDLLVPIIEGFFSSAGAGLALIIGIGTAMWAASGYVAAFARAHNRVYDTAEGRHPVRLKLQQLALTATILLGVVLLLGAVVLSGDLARWIGDLAGLGSQAVRVWDLAKWPVMLLLTMGLVAALYHWTPNIAFPRFRPITVGSTVAVLVAVIAAAGFSFYASRFGSYDKTYGTLAGVIIALWLVWLINLALVFGATLDAEVRRTRQLAAGEPAERQPLLPPRAFDGIIKARQKANAVAAEGHQIRVEAAAD
ncbi:MAG: YihY/virulence factor BrkB family protein [Brooklawnia sp.]|jgi:membrane protein